MVISNILYSIMDNEEQVLDELIDFEKCVDKTITPLLNEYLSCVARTGKVIFPWIRVRGVVIRKLEEVVEKFMEDSPLENVPTMPNGQVMECDKKKDQLLRHLSTFTNPPFTIQRICEMLVEPRRHYARTDKYLRGLEKNIFVVSTLNEYSLANGDHSGASPLVNGELEVEDESSEGSCSMSSLDEGLASATPTECPWPQPHENNMPLWAGGRRDEVDTRGDGQDTRGDGPEERWQEASDITGTVLMECVQAVCKQLETGPGQNHTAPATPPPPVHATPATPPPPTHATPQTTPIASTPTQTTSPSSTNATTPSTTQTTPPATTQTTAPATTQTTTPATTQTTTPATTQTTTPATTQTATPATTQTASPATTQTASPDTTQTATPATTQTATPATTQTASPATTQTTATTLATPVDIVQATSLSANMPSAATSNTETMPSSDISTVSSTLLTDTLVPSPPPPATYLSTPSPPATSSSSSSTPTPPPLPAIAATSPASSAVASTVGVCVSGDVHHHMHHMEESGLEVSLGATCESILSLLQDEPGEGMQVDSEVIEDSERLPPPSIPPSAGDTSDDQVSSPAKKLRLDGSDDSSDEVAISGS